MLGWCRGFKLLVVAPLCLVAVRRCPLPVPGLPPLCSAAGVVRDSVGVPVTVLCSGTKAGALGRPWAETAAVLCVA